MDYNHKTLQTYEKNTLKYVDKTPHTASAHVNDWIDRSLKRIDKKDTILEIGSAFGRDANYIESKGFIVQRSDATKAFVSLLRKSGKKARILNVLTDDLGDSYGMVFANAVFLHFKPAELNDVLTKIYKSLRSSGVLAFAVKKGRGSRWKEDKMGGPRFFHFWQPENLMKQVVGAGFENIELTEGKSTNAEWLHVIAQKPKAL